MGASSLISIRLMRLSMVALMGLSLCSFLPAESAIDKAANLSGAPSATETRQKLLKVLRLINVENYIHQNERSDSSSKGPNYVSFPDKFSPTIDPNTGKPRETHPYEWDSLRSPSEILSRRDGGSCGSHALAIASLLKASGIESDNIRLVGTVLADHYADICPGKRGKTRKESWSFSQEDGKTTVKTIHPANGHVFLQVKINGSWHLLNSTCDPLNLRESPETEPKKYLRELTKKCEPLPKGQERRRCFNEARSKAFEKVRLEDFELLPYQQILPEDLEAGTSPRVFPVPAFPSLKYLNPIPNATQAPPLVPFAVWSLENYPKHTIEQRANLVASGKLNDKTCRWSAKEVMATALNSLKPLNPSPGALTGKQHSIDK